jgi:hypothetical protein
MILSISYITDKTKSKLVLFLKVTEGQSGDVSC